MEEETRNKGALTKLETGGNLPVSPFQSWIDGELNFKALHQLANAFSQSDLVPKHFQGKPTNCFIALQIAHRAGEDPFEVLQNLYVIHGNPGFKAKYLISRANRSGVFDGRLKFKTENDPTEGLKVTCYGTLKETGEVVSMSASIALAKAEGWYQTNKKYQTMPEVMLGYRAASFLISRYAPEISIGLPMTEEIEDMVGAELTVRASSKGKERTRSGAAASINAKIEENKRKAAVASEEVVNVEEETPL